MRIPCYIAALVLCGATAFGRIGDTETQIQKLYGKPTPSSSSTRSYFYKALFIIVTFDNGLSGIETYQKRDEALMSAGEIRQLLDANGDGTKWQEPIRNGLEVHYKQTTCFAEYNGITNTLTIADYAALSRINVRNQALDAHK
jgi:hypothetical protein